MRYLDSSVIIGNLIILSLNKELNSLSTKEILKIGKSLEKPLQSLEYYFHLDENEISKFTYEYSFFAKLDQDHLNITFQVNDTTRLERYFQFGHSSRVIETIAKIYKKL